MICADTNVFIDFFRNRSAKIAEALQKSLANRQLMMNPFVLSELLSSPKLPLKTEKYLVDLPRIEIETGFFLRAGLLRRKIYQVGRGVSISDIYIAQSCIDVQTPLLSTDQDLVLISKFSELKVIDS